MKKIYLIICCALLGSLSQAREADIGLTKEQLDESSEYLNQLLSDEYVLYVKTLKYHWNLFGRQFHDMHLFFEKQYKQLFKFIDAIAERVRALDHPAFGAMGQFLDHTRLQEGPDTVPELDGMVENLLADHEKIIRSIRGAVEKLAFDTGTSNFLQDLIVKQEKMAWMLRAFLQNNNQK